MCLSLYLGKYLSLNNSKKVQSTYKAQHTEHSQNLEGSSQPWYGGEIRSPTKHPLLCCHPSDRPHPWFFNLPGNLIRYICLLTLLRHCFDRGSTEVRSSHPGQLTHSPLPFHDSREKSVEWFRNWTVFQNLMFLLTRESRDIARDALLDPTFVRVRVRVTVLAQGQSARHHVPTIFPPCLGFRRDQVSTLGQQLRNAAIDFVKLELGYCLFGFQTVVMRRALKFWTEWSGWNWCWWACTIIGSSCCFFFLPLWTGSTFSWAVQLLVGRLDSRQKLRWDRATTVGR